MPKPGQFRKEYMNHNHYTKFFAAFLCLAAAELGAGPHGADAVPDLYSPATAGFGGFSTTQGGAPAGALNPAQGGDAQRMVFDLGYIGIGGLGDEGGYGNDIELGALIPTKYMVFGGSLRFINSPFEESLPIGNVFSGNLNVSKELLRGMSLGLGLNFGFGTDWSLNGDLGFRYNIGKLGPFPNFTWALAFRGLGKSFYPSPFTPLGGISFDIVQIEGKEGKPIPFRLGFAADAGVPSLFDWDHTSLIFKTGLNMTFAEIVNLGISWPGASGLNVRELSRGEPFVAAPSIGLSVDIKLKSGGKGLAGGWLPSDGDLIIAGGAKPLYNDIWAFGGGLTWYAGIMDRTPPAITVDYPEVVYMSPNNDGKGDDLEFPVTITDSRYVSSWTMEVKNEAGDTVRSFRNAERRPETEDRVKNILGMITDVKSGVIVPPVFRWDGIMENGETAPDGTYTFVIGSADDNGNIAATQGYTVVVDNTPPAVEIAVPGEQERIFSPDGDGNKDVLSFAVSGSREDLWDAGIHDASGVKIRSFDLVDREPEAVVWNGLDDSGNIVPDGVYSFAVSSTDRAQNHTESVMENIIVNTIQPVVNLYISDGAFSPNADGIKDTVSFSPSIPVREGITGWTVRINDVRGNALRTLRGGGDVPSRIEYDGKNDSGAGLSEGIYQGTLSVNYRNGYVSTAVSPPFTLDITAPAAFVRNEYPAFSPDNDGNQDEMIFTQQGSAEGIWTAEIRRREAGPDERPVKTYRLQGSPPARAGWDGRGDGGAPAADGEYVYELVSTDAAGNTGRSNQVGFSLSTADTPVMLSTDTRSFSPNGDRVRDTINIIPVIQVSEGISSWKIDVYDESSRAIRTFEGRGGAPGPQTWNGRDSAGNLVGDGTYTAKIELRYVQGNQPSAVSAPFTADTEAPRAELSSAFTLFSPNGDGNRDFLPIKVRTEAYDHWEAGLTDSSGNLIRSWSWDGSAPDLPWDGTDQAGNTVPDGTYHFTLKSTDEGGNSASLNLPPIVLDARIPRVFLTSSVSAAAPKPGQAADLIRFSPIVSLREGIESWNLELRGEDGSLFKTYSGNADVPASLGWNGLSDSGNLREGRYTPHLRVRYAKGDIADAEAPSILIDVSGPELGFSYSPEYFSPDNDGVEDELSMFLSANDASPIERWSLEIREPEGPNLLFYRLEGRGNPTPRSIWNGRSNRGELVQAATDYPYTFTAEDTLGNASGISGKIGVDVLVIRDGDNLKIQVPSIVFRANAADFDGLPQATVDNNSRIMRRVAEILNKFRDYRVQVEGHANPTTAPGTAARGSEEQGGRGVIGLKPLSEDRARAVLDILIRNGVSRSRLSYVGVGGARTVVRFEDRDNWWKNRRVEFILIK
ncbi:MAG: gliding motility-associated C-terminal domain-containing protein [Treponema sp.]|jgi:flagellar hook assembly protein FlgD|nr:gliding motility-associated C-terminal domain-containing protein [Treponema sp.]